MKQFKKYCIGMLLLMTLVMVTACGRANNGAATDNNGAAGENGTGTDDGNGTGTGTNVDDILFDTDEDGVYDHTDVDGDGLLEEIGNDANDVVDDLINDVTGDDTMVDGNVDNNGTVNGTGTVGDGAGTDLP